MACVNAAKTKPFAPRTLFSVSNWMSRARSTKPGDIIPCDFDGQLTLLAEGIAVVRGSYAASRGQQALKVTQRVSRHKSAVLSNVEIGERVML